MMAAPTVPLATARADDSTPWTPSADSRPQFLREHVAFLGLVALYVAAGLAVDWSGVVPGMMGRMKFVLGYLLTPFFVILATPVVVAWRFGAILRQGERMLGRLSWADWGLAWRRCRSEMLNRERLLAVLTVSLVSPVFLTAFGSWKAAIPLLNGFKWDLRLSHLDTAVHFGVYPWQLLQPILGRPWITNSIDYFYAWWVLLVPVVLTWQAWSSRWELRRQFLITFVVTWIALGTALAIVFSSAGPCFLTRLGLDGSAYAPLMSYLQSTHASYRLLAIETQDWLWAAYTMDTLNPFVRISAMPSIHVAMTVLYALVAWRTSHWLGWLFGMYALFVFVGSIHLAWHYAVDGYLSAGLVVAIWCLVGRFVRRRQDLTRKE